MQLAAVSLVPNLRLLRLDQVQRQTSSALSLLLALVLPLVLKKSSRVLLSSKLTELISPLLHPPQLVLPIQSITLLGKPILPPILLSVRRDRPIFSTPSLLCFLTGAAVGKN